MLASNLFRSPHARRTLALLLSQQLIVASSTFLIAKLAAAVVGSENFWWLGLAYALSLTLPYLPGARAIFELNAWEQDLKADYFARFVANYQSRVALWRRQDLRRQKTAYVSKEGPQALTDTTRFLWEATSTGLNVLLNVAALSLVIHPIFAVSYGLGLSVGVFILKKAAPKTEALATEAQDKSVGLTGHLAKAWDNVVLGNSYNLAKWQAGLKDHFTQSRRWALRLAAYSQRISVAVAFGTFVPGLAAATWFLLQHLHDPPQVAALLVTLPRLFMILNFTHTIFDLGLSWSGTKARVVEAYREIEKMDELPVGQIRWDGIEIARGAEKFKVGSWEEFLEQLPRSGRITIRGENGAGKSTLLLRLKEERSQESFYLPAKCELEFKTQEAGSTGQMARRHLTEIVEGSSERILLLDEWDANLDAGNRQSLSDLINVAAQKRCVIEIRHGH